MRDIGATIFLRVVSADTNSAAPVAHRKKVNMLQQLLFTNFIFAKETFYLIGNINLSITGC
jgi:hypothetical protein